MFPSDGVGHFAVRAGLLGKNDTAAIGMQPLHGFLDELRVGHVTNVRESLADWKYLGSFAGSSLMSREMKDRPAAVGEAIISAFGFWGSSDLHGAVNVVVRTQNDAHWCKSIRAFVFALEIEENG